MSTEIEYLQTKLGPLRDELHEIHGRAKAEERTLTKGEETRWNNLMAGVKRVEAEIAERKAKEAELRDLARKPGHLERGDAPGVMTRVDPFDEQSPVVDRARKLIDSERTADVLGSDGQERLEKIVRTKEASLDGEVVATRLVMTERPEYRSAFRRLISSPRPLLTNEEVQAIRELDEFDARAMSIGTDNAGGFGVPVLIDPTVILTGQGSPNDFFAISRVETITTDEWKGVSSAGVTWSFDAEAAEVSDDSPTLAQPTVPTHKAQGFVPFSIEVGQDYPGFDVEIGRLLAEGYSELVVEKFTTGSGTGEPTGIVTALDANTNVEVTPTTDGAFGAVDVYKLWDALPSRSKPGASWMSSTDVQNEIRQFGTDTGHTFSVNLVQEEITRLFGKRYYLNDFMADFTGTTGAANLLIVGDFRNFLIAQRAGMRVELVQHLLGTNRRPSGQRGLYAWARVGSDMVNDLGARLMQNQ